MSARRRLSRVLVGALLTGPLAGCTEPADVGAGSLASSEARTTIPSSSGANHSGSVVRVRRALGRLDLATLDPGTLDPGTLDPSSTSTPRTGYAASLARTARRLRLHELSWRYVAPAGPSAVLADVTWRLPEDRRATTSRVTVTLSDSAAAVTRVTGAGERWPTWLAGPVAVRRTPGAVVVVAGSGPAADRTARAYAALAGRSLAVVRRVVPARRPLVLEIPASRVAMTDALAGRPGEYDGVAAVTTTADAALDALAPVRVVVNRELTDTLGTRARRVVIAHEVTHAETGAATARMPLWLLEGFADYVALRDVGLAEARLAGRAATAARADGVPPRLPVAADFTGPGADAAYEGAWLACRVLVARGGEHRLVRLYRRVRAGTTAGMGLREVFGTSQRQLTRVWRMRLARLAG